MSESQLIFERNEKGEVRTGGGIQVQFPQNRSALAVLGVNSIAHGDDFRPDGWVYGPDGTKRRKWFCTPLRYNNNRIWEPHLEQVATLETKRWKWWNRAHDKFGPWRNEVVAKLKKYGTVGGWWATNRYGNVGWVEIDVDDHGYGDAVGWHWKDEEPPVRDDALVEEWFRYERASNDGWRRVYLFNACFIEAINRRMRPQMKELNYRQEAIHLTINSRSYWFKVVKQGLERLAFPEDAVFETVLTD